MPKSTTAILGTRIIEIQSALELRRAGNKLNLRCIECGEPVRAHKEGTTKQAAHFEHLTRNERCHLSC